MFRSSNMNVEYYNVEDIPFDMLFEICRLSESLALLTTSKALNTYLTTGVTLDFMVFLGYDVKISRTFWGDVALVWLRDGLFHRVRGPAIEYPTGEKFWYLHGKQHRENGPAAEFSTGEKHWYLHGLLHREDGPAVEIPNEVKEYYSHGRLHREDGPAVERKDGTKEWYINGKRCLENGFLLNEVCVPNLENFWKEIRS